jgi:hypothetical protein
VTAPSTKVNSDASISLCRRMVQVFDQVEVFCLIIISSCGFQSAEFRARSSVTSDFSHNVWADMPAESFKTADIRVFVFWNGICLAIYVTSYGSSFRVLDFV